MSIEENIKIPVSYKALRELLNALNGPGYYIRELQVTRSLPGNNNPINVITTQFNEAVERVNKSMETPLLIQDHGFQTVLGLSGFHEEGWLGDLADLRKIYDNTLEFAVKESKR
jgi:hypothetical protein